MEGHGMNASCSYRDALKNRFASTEFDDFDDQAALELLLFYAMPRKETAGIAQRLIAWFGSFDVVLEASIEDLKKVDGVGANTALLIKMVIPLGRKYMLSQKRKETILNSTEKAGNYLIPHFYGLRDEVMYMVCLNSKLKVLDCRRMFSGCVNSASIHVRKIAEHALIQNAASVILAHNHIGGDRYPSCEDEEITLRVNTALRNIDITLTDHIIVADGDYMSMAEHGFIKQ
jgi:DNA repair protein RadC